MRREQKEASDCTTDVDGRSLGLPKEGQGACSTAPICSARCTQSESGQRLIAGSTRGPSVEEGDAHDAASVAAHPTTNPDTQACWDVIAGRLLGN